MTSQCAPYHVTIVMVLVQVSEIPPFITYRTELEFHKALLTYASIHNYLQGIVRRHKLYHLCIMPDMTTL